MGSTLDPAINKLYAFTDGVPMAAIYGGLDYLDPSTGKVVMNQLKSMTPNTDNTVWTMVLNPDIKFSDGTPLNAQAIMFNYQRFADPATASIWAPVAKALQMKVVDDLTLQVTLAAPNAAFPALVAEDLGAVASPTAIQAEGKGFAIAPVGAGPFKVQKFDAGQSLTVVRNTYYSSFRPGQPYLDSITFQSLPDPTQQINALSSNQAQAAWPIGTGVINQMKGAGANVATTDTGGGADLLMNNSIAPFNDPIARQAFSLALDRTSVANAFAPSTPAATNLFPKNSPFFDPKYNFPQQDKTKAQQLFDQLAAAGKPLDFVLTVDNIPQQLNTANLIQSQLAQYKNVKMTIKAETPTAYSGDSAKGNYQMLPHGLYMITPVPDATDYFATNGTLNTFKWNNPTANQALQTIIKSSDLTEQKKDWAVVQEQLLADNPIYFMNQGVIGFASSKSLTNVHLMNNGNYPDYGALGYKQGS